MKSFLNLQILFSRSLSYAGRDSMRNTFSNSPSKNAVLPHHTKVDPIQKNIAKDDKMQNCIHLNNRRGYLLIVYLSPHRDYILLPPISSYAFPIKHLFLLIYIPQEHL